MSSTFSSVRELLKSVALDSYIETFELEGWGSVDALFDINETDLTSFISDVQTKSWHVLHKVLNMTAPNAASGPAGASVSAMATATMVPVPYRVCPGPSPCDYTSIHMSPPYRSRLCNM